MGMGGGTESEVSNLVGVASAEPYRACRSNCQGNSLWRFATYRAPWNSATRCAISEVRGHDFEGWKKTLGVARWFESSHDTLAQPHCL